VKPEGHFMSIVKDSSLFRSQAYINGEWVDADSGDSVPVTNPADGSTLICVPDMGADETRRAIDAANAALPAWSARTAKDRAVILRRWYELIMENQEDLARLMTAEQGKPLAESRGEVAYGASFVEWFAEEGKRTYGDVIPHHAPGKRLITIKQPVGVIAAITPWNFPNAMITRKVAPALAAGCTTLVKPAAETPLSALALAELGERAGFPPGIFNVITTGHASRVGGEMTSNPIVRKFSFTGSTEIGKLLMKQCADTVKKVTMELGGNAPFIVFDDADLDAAVQGALASKYRNAGQTCVCANRFLVQDGVYDAFAEKLAAATAKLVVGRGESDGVSMGPLINKDAIDKVESIVKDAIDKGATVILGGKRDATGSNFYQPTILTNVSADMEVASEEIFGPVAPLFRFKTDDEAIRIANDTPFGLAAYFYSRDIARVWKIAESLEYGMVGINEGILSTEVAPFGGVKESGVGREGSKYGIDEYMEIKYLCLGGMDS
jgi:succinate-semialdehyde dehydrogenase/glutarate-semialdehyde dehydrogenase